MRDRYGRCSNCGESMPNDASVCPHCGTCEKCGRRIPSSAHYCPYCGNYAERGGSGDGCLIIILAGLSFLVYAIMGSAQRSTLFAKRGVSEGKSQICQIAQPFIERSRK